MSNIINTRSPFFRKYTLLNAGTISQATIDIRIWSGLRTAPPANPTYTLNKTPLVNEVGNYVALEVSELVRDYIYTDYYEDATDAVWVTLDVNLQSDIGEQESTEEFLGIDGYGYFEEGINPREETEPGSDDYTPMVLQSNMTVYFVPGRDIKIPVFSEYEPLVSTEIIGGLWNSNENFWEVESSNWESITTNIQVDDSDNSQDKIQYVILTSDEAKTGDTITFTATDGSEEVQVINLVEICETRFDNYRSVFYNKFGALQSFWVTKKSTITTNIKSQNYESNILDYSGSDVSYSTTKHNKKRFQVVANQSINTNTEIISDDQNEPLEQLLMSEQVWLEKSEGDTLPVTVKTASLLRKTGVNDKIVQYAIDFDYAFNKINSIR